MPFAGVGWQVAQYLEGLRRLGHDVFYLEDTLQWPYDPVKQTVCDDATAALHYVAAVMRRAGMEGRWAYLDVATGGRVHGVSERRLHAIMRDAEILINLSGVMVLREEHLHIPVRVYLETDPVRPQIEVAQGNQRTIDLLAAHTHHFTYGENFGAADCGVPLERFDYRPTRPPVILDWWEGVAPPAAPDERPFSTVANWRQTGKDIHWGGRLLTWSKHVEFERFLSLPSQTELSLELALALDDPNVADHLRSFGWRVVPARPLSSDLDAYRNYILASAGEFSVAKEQNVLLRSGWFSDRTATYLAAGRPAIVQDTGFAGALRTGRGLLTFRDIDEAQRALEEVRANYLEHCRAAREIAHDHLRAEAVLARFLDDILSSAALQL